MSTFDQILPSISEVLHAHAADLQKLGAIVVNRDLNGRVRLVVDEKVLDDAEAKASLDAIVQAFADPPRPTWLPR